MKNTKNSSITLGSLIVIAALISATIFSGCNTVRGVGEDTEATGEAIQDASN